MPKLWSYEAEVYEFPQQKMAAYRNGSSRYYHCYHSNGCLTFMDAVQLIAVQAAVT